MALSASALGRSSRLPTKPPIIDWRSGVSKLLRMPRVSDMAMMKPVVISPEAVSAASTKACSASSDWMRSSHFFLSCLSIQAPASGPTTSCGINAQKAVTPSSAAEPVKR